MCAHGMRFYQGLPWPELHRRIFTISHRGARSKKKKNPTTNWICWLCVSRNILAFTHSFFSFILGVKKRKIDFIRNAKKKNILFFSPTEIETVRHLVSMAELGLSVAISSILFHSTCRLKDLLSSLGRIIICRSL